MADTVMYDFTAETAMTAAHKFGVQTANNVDPKSATFALMGGLEWATYGTPDQNNAAVVGQIIGWDISTLSADRNWTLPNDAKVGERCGIFITTGDDAYEVDILTDATGSEINGVNHGVTSWSRLFITNECLILRCIKAGGVGDTDWIVEHDGRIPCNCKIYLNTSTSSNYLASAGTYYQVPFDSTDVDNASMANLAQDHIDIRRTSEYLIAGGWASHDSLTDNEYANTKLAKNNNATNLGNRADNVNGTAASFQVFHSERVSGTTLNNDDTLELWVRFVTSSNIDIYGGTKETKLELLEVFV
jgi:hypothetical protein